MAHALLAMTIALALSTTDRTPPTEFRIFRAGETASTKGTVLFDEQAASSVMDEYAAHGIELPIDWDHAMVREDSPVKDRRAAGWFKLAVRSGELWAVEIRWTAEADALLREVIRVYMLARRGLLPARSGDTDRVMFAALSELRGIQPSQGAALTQQAQAVTALVSAVSQLGDLVRTIFDDRATLSRASAGRSGAKWISGQLKLYGSLMGDGTKGDASSWRSRGETELRGHLGYSGAGRAWHDLPIDDFARARVKLAEMNKSAERIGQRRQQPLPGAAE